MRHRIMINYNNFANTAYNLQSGGKPKKQFTRPPPPKPDPEFLKKAELALYTLYNNIFIYVEFFAGKIDNVFIPVISGAIFTGGDYNFRKMTREVYKTFINYVTTHPVDTTFYFSDHLKIDKTHESIKYYPSYPKGDFSKHDFYTNLNLSEDQNNLIVNASNSNFRPGGGGTNGALTRMFSGWTNIRKFNKSDTDIDNIRISDPNKSKYGVKIILHALGPNNQTKELGTTED
jgi:hypothetical protein